MVPLSEGIPYISNIHRISVKTLNFGNSRVWIQDVRDWVSWTRRPIHSQAHAIVSALDGHARGVAGQLHAEELIQGGYLNGLQYDPVTYLLLCLAPAYTAH